MSRRRIYVNISELNYRGLRRLGVYSGERVGVILERLANQYVAHHVLNDDAFSRWMDAEWRDICYGSPPPPDIRHLHNRVRRSGINADHDDDEWPRSPQDHDERPQ